MDMCYVIENVFILKRKLNINGFENELSPKYILLFEYRWRIKLDFSHASLDLLHEKSMDGSNKIVGSKVSSIIDLSKPFL